MTGISQIDFATLMHLTGGKRGVIDAPCPECGPSRRATMNQKRKVLRIWDDGELVTFCCARCGVEGWAKDNAGVHAARTEFQPKSAAADSSDKTEIARFLWSKSAPARGTVVEVYLKARKCWIESPNIRFLPGRNEHPPAMISRFGRGELTGVHLTKLKADGSGKAGTEKDKIMLGPSLGQPIIVSENHERGELAVAEGIEDVASMALATGWSGWAAGSARRIPSIVSGMAAFDAIYIGVDYDPVDRASERAFQKALRERRDLIPVRFAKILGRKERYDANKVLIDYGPEAITAAIEWCDAQARHYRGHIGFSAMERAAAKANEFFASIAFQQAEGRSLRNG